MWAIIWETVKLRQNYVLLLWNKNYQMSFRNCIAANGRIWFMYCWITLLLIFKVLVLSDLTFDLVYVDSVWMHVQTIGLSWCFRGRWGIPNLNPIDKNKMCIREANCASGRLTPSWALWIAGWRMWFDYDYCLNADLQFLWASWGQCRKPVLWCMKWGVWTLVFMHSHHTWVYISRNWAIIKEISHDC